MAAASVAAAAVAAIGEKVGSLPEEGVEAAAVRAEVYPNCRPPDGITTVQMERYACCALSVFARRK